VSGERLEVEPDRAHPLRHQRAPEFDAVAGVNRLLPVKRQAVGVFRHRDLREQRFGRQAGFDDVLGSRRLQDRRGLPVGVFRTDRHDQPEARPHDVEPDALLLADLDPLLAFELRRDLGLHDLLDPLQMRGETGLALRGLARLGARLGGQPRLDGRDPRLPLFEDEALLVGLVGVELFRTLAERAATKRLQNRRQPLDLRFRRRVRLHEILDLRFQAQRLGKDSLRFGLVGGSFRLETIGASLCCKRQRFELVNVVSKLAESFGHALHASVFVDESLLFSRTFRALGVSFQSTGALRRSHVHRANSLPIEPSTSATACA
jgi:hypothetical protein